MQPPHHDNYLPIMHKPPSNNKRSKRCYKIPSLQNITPIRQ
ncbi:hypothetical protein BVRB_6g135890 [Beta vulgaris subsp. vulgaris]|nr:hypothetical protein BVRB_6g135890 [Beta vulgaris subsp. vulgaris]